VATTRPETMLADMAVAVNPSDARYTALIGKMVKLPITGRLIPIVADDHADPELGSGAVKITPGHDFNDFEVGKRAGFRPAEMLNMLDAEARVVQCGDTPEALLGLSVADARKEVVALIEAAGLLEKVEDRVIQTPYGDRSGVVIEPWLTDQWYVDAKTLAGPAIEAVRSGAIDVVPKSWEKTYFNWMENIQPWCVSRQLWWGHRIPAWHGSSMTKLENGSYGITGHQIFVAESEEQALAQAKEYYAEFIDNPPVEVISHIAANRPFSEMDGEFNWFSISRDSDVLDTWFSSALWPFGTLGWPEHNRHPGAGRDPVPSEQPSEASEHPARLGPGLRRDDDGGRSAPPNSLLSRHYPGDVLVSGFDILFFWDARMIMQGLHFMKEVPFKTLYLHGLVRAADGSKMSKSKGNTVDPLGLIDQYGADALRFFMAAMESQGRDIKMDESRVTGYRNFATKLWNAARFCQSNGIGASASVAAPVAELAVNKWIIGEVVETLAKLNKAFEELRFDGMADTIYHFAWGTFCDWYLELIKPAFVDGEKQEMDTESKIVAGWVFDQILVMLHPFMPFITEELWGSMGDRGGNMLIHANWPEPAVTADVQAQGEISWVISVIDAIRSARADNQIPPASKLSVCVTDATAETSARIGKHGTAISKIARIESWDVGGAGDGIQVVVGEATYTLGYESTVDPAVERERLTKAVESVVKERDSLAGRLNNPAFVEKAKLEAVEKARADHAEKAAEAERLTAALARLG
jgi:valyl-tRNA synthetase